MSSETMNINVPILARVEGEGALDINIVDNKIEQIHLKIYEPPRYFEKFLEGREHQEVLDIVTRICGICPVAYQMSAVKALEQIFAMPVSPWVREMRRAFYCGEWIESHGLHIHMLAAPDFLGYESAPAMAKDYPNEVKRGMRLHALGNDLLKLFGARSVHPVGACVGGFFKAPSIKQVNAVLEKLKQGLQDAEDLVMWAASMPFPDGHDDFPCVSLKHPDEYPMNEGLIYSDNGLVIDEALFEQHYKEQHVPYTTALQCLQDGKPYLVGPLARMNNCFAQLPEQVQRLAKKTGISWPSKNTFHSIVARALEIYYCMLEAIRILEQYQLPEQASLVATPKAGVGFGATEAPRGLLWHRYETDDNGLVMASTIVPPTSQNQARIEEDLRYALERFGLDKSHDALRLHSEMVIRNYDPCISCSVHFLDLRVKHGN